MNDARRCGRVFWRILVLYWNCGADTGTALCTGVVSCLWSRWPNVRGSKQFMKIIGPLIATLLLSAGGSGCKKPTPDEGATFVPNGAMRDEATFDGFTVRTYRSGAGCGSFEILRGERRIYAQHGFCFSIGGQEGNRKDVMRWAPVPGADITGNGRPDVIVYEWTGGAHCSFIARVFELGDRCEKLATIDGVHGTPAFVDVDRDSVPEVVIYDWSFAYWPASVVSLTLLYIWRSWPGFVRPGRSRRMAWDSGCVRRCIGLSRE